LAILIGCMMTFLFFCCLSIFLLIKSVRIRFKLTYYNVVDTVIIVLIMGITIYNGIKILINDKYNWAAHATGLLLIITVLFLVWILLLNINRFIFEDFLKNKLVNSIRSITFYAPLVEAYFIFLIYNNPKNLEGYCRNAIMQFIFFLWVAHLIISLLLIAKGIAECILSKDAVLSKNEDISLLKTKVLLLVTWFVIIFTYSTVMVYITYKFDKNAFVYNLQNHDFSRHGLFNSAYLSLITMFTIGYGDIVPNNSLGKIVISSISIMSAYFMIIGVAGILGASEYNLKVGGSTEENKETVTELSSDLKEEVHSKEEITKCINELFRLHKKGAISKREFKKNKKKLLNRL